MKTDRTGNLADQVASFVLSDIQLPSQTLDRAKIVISDTLSATVAGSTSDVLGPLKQYLQEQTPVDADKIILGTELRTTPELAALTNGTMASALEFDDVMSLMPGHPSAVVLSALMASDAALNASGEELIKAYAVGIEAGVRIAQAITLDHYKRGFHATGTLALFSAVCALGRIHGVSHSKLKQAIGIAASMASGVQGNFGTMTKPLHSGWAARNAVAAVSLASVGLTANEQIFEAEGGFFASYGSDASNIDKMPTTFGRPWVFDEPGITLKLYPCCYASHRGMDALTQIMKRLNVGAKDIRQIRCQAPIGGLIPLKFARPSTHFESLFSLPYSLAITALDIMPGLDSFAQKRVVAADVADVLSRIDVVESEECVRDYPDFQITSYGSRGEVRVQVETYDGRSDRQAIQIAPGHPKRPMTWDQAQSKFMGCLAAAGLSKQKAQAVFPTIRELEKLANFRSLVEQLTA
jgi:2-methylcitrate dehydratase PrpD